MSLINSKLCKFDMNYAIFFSIISGNTVKYKICIITEAITKYSNIYSYNSGNE